MNPIRLFKKSIQNKIFISFLLVMVIPTTAISMASYFVSVDILKQKVSQSFQENLMYIGNSTVKELSGIEKITELIYIDDNIQYALNSESRSDQQYYTNLKKVDQVINNISFYSNYYNYITSLFIFGSNGSEFMYGNEAYAIDTKQLRESAWYKRMLDLNGKVLWIGLHDNESSISRSKPVFSIARAINDVNNRNIGSIYLSLNTSVFSDILSKASPNTQSQIYIVDQFGKIVFPEQKVAMSLESEGIVLPQTTSKASFEIKKNGQLFLASTYDIEKYGWKIIQTVPMEILTKDNKVIFEITAIVFIVSFLFSGIIWFFISASIVRPIKRLTLTMKDVKATNLLVKSDIKSLDEIGLLSVTYNYMIERINFLFNQVVEEEQKKRNAEIKALQGQITPHFLYNTLNAIRWMAIIQKAEGIKEVVDALGRLLKNTFKQKSTIISLNEELGMIKDYVYIQQTRYRDKFQVYYEVDEQLLQAKCVKFILQPIVENAIFHGIEPKEEPGIIKIKVSGRGSVLHITVEDNGVGMTASRISEMINDGKLVQDASQGIGVQNVDNRIKMICGEMYGLQIESKVDVFTKVHIRLPLDISYES
jgi:two-component system sensor histidine kinase YesM